MQKLQNTHVSYMYLYIRNVCNNDVIGLRCTCGSLYELFKKDNNAFKLFTSNLYEIQMQRFILMNAIITYAFDVK